ncbi:MAG: hypothetical protein ACREYE_19205 [Gammaproteobacteria bacterium]
MPDLKEAIEELRQAWNQNPKPFIWTATVEDIIKKIERARVKMEQIKPRSTLPRGKKEGGLTVKLFKGHYTRPKHPATLMDRTKPCESSKVFTHHPCVGTRRDGSGPSALGAGYPVSTKRRPQIPRRRLVAQAL